MGQTFDTLEATGMEHKQAEAVTETVRNVQVDLGGLATLATVVILVVNLP